MTTYTVTETGRSYAAQRYNRTTGRWLDGGPDRLIDIRDDDSGTAIGDLSNGELIDAAATIAESDRDDAGELADAVAEEIERRLAAIGAEIDGWDGESARWLADRLNDLEMLAERATNALKYVPGRPYGYDFRETDWYDITSLGWHSDRQTNYEHVYACDKHGVFVVLVAGTTDDGWTTEEPEEGEAG